MSSYAQQLLNDYTDYKEGKVKFKAKEGFIRPSSLGCMVKARYLFDGIEPTEYGIPLRNLEIMDAGTDGHERMQKVISKLGGDWEWLLIRDNPELITHPKVSIDEFDAIYEDQFETLLRYKNDLFEMRFKADGLLVYKKEKKFILEIKTIGHKAFEQLSKPKEEHVTQVTLYSAMYQVSDVIFIYEDRDTLDKKVFEIHITPEMTKRLYKQILTYLVDRKPVGFGNYSYICPYCEYYDKCGPKMFDTWREEYYGVID